VDVSAYTHSLALASDGHVYAWGNGSNGQLGLNSDNDHTIPYQVHGVGNTQPPNGLSGIVDVDAGYYHSLAVGSGDGYVYSWGYNGEGELGVGTWGKGVDHYYPVKVTSPAGFVAVSGGGFHSTAVQSPGVLWAWGSNSDGQLGHPDTVYRATTPWFVGNFRSVAAGDSHTLGVSSYGGLWAWGHNNYGQLGDGTTTDRDYPVQVGGLVGGPEEKDTIKPWVTQVVPADAAPDVTRGSKVIATFSEEMNPTTITQKTFTLMKEDTTATEVAAKVSYNSATSKATLDPTKPLDKGETYTATVSTEATDLAGNPLDQDHASSGDQPKEWSFTVKN
jgi:hypothetical protein